MNGINSLSYEKDINNTSSTPKLAEKAHKTSAPTPEPVENKPSIENSTVSISSEAKLLNRGNDSTAMTSKGNVLPDYLKPPPQGYTPNPSATSGNTFHFLTSSDRETINSAFDYAIENDLDTEEVGLAAFFLANQRHVESMIASGVKYVVHNPELHSDSPTSEPGNSSAHESARAVLTEKALSGELFSDNPVLNQPLFIKALFNALRLSNNALEKRIANI